MRSGSGMSRHAGQRGARRLHRGVDLVGSGQRHRRLHRAGRRVVVRVGARASGARPVPADHHAPLGQPLDQLCCAAASIVMAITLRPPPSVGLRHRVLASCSLRCAPQPGRSDRRLTSVSKLRLVPSSQDIRARLEHPVIDADGHVLEYLPAVEPHLREALGQRRLRALPEPVEPAPPDHGRRQRPPPRHPHAAERVVGHAGPQHPRPRHRGGARSSCTTAWTSSASTTRSSIRRRASASPASRTTSCASASAAASTSSTRPPTGPSPTG